MEVLESGLNKGGAGDIVLDEQGNVVPPRQPFWQDPKSLEPILKMIDAKPETFKSAVTPDFRMGSIIVRTGLTSSKEIERTLGEIRDYALKQFPPRLHVQMTGSLVLLTGTASDIVAGPVRLASAAVLPVLGFERTPRKIGVRICRRSFSSTSGSASHTCPMMAFGRWKRSCISASHSLIFGSSARASSNV